MPRRISTGAPQASDTAAAAASKGQRLSAYLGMHLHTLSEGMGPGSPNISA